jgi:hypothetical protein
VASDREVDGMTAFILGLLLILASTYGIGACVRTTGRKKARKDRLLSLPELAALEIECGIEPSWTPPPVASLVTRPPAGGYHSGGVVPVPGLMTYDPAKDGPILQRKDYRRPPSLYCMTCHSTSCTKAHWKGVAT